MVLLGIELYKKHDIVLQLLQCSVWGCLFFIHLKTCQTCLSFQHTGKEAVLVADESSLSRNVSVPSCQYTQENTCTRYIMSIFSILKSDSFSSTLQSLSGKAMEVAGTVGKNIPQSVQDLGNRAKDAAGSVGKNIPQSLYLLVVSLLFLRNNRCTDIICLPSSLPRIPGTVQSNSRSAGSSPAVFQTALPA